ncbi:MAG: DNA alkylation repair protein [Saprospiraceae bacterium]
MAKSLSIQAYYERVRDTFQAAGNPEVAEGQMQYMRNQFEYFGLKMPAWTALAKALFKDLGFPGNDELPDLVRLCLADDHREMHYFGLELCQKRLKLQEAGFIDFLEELIITRSWWDTVDWLAKLTGIHFQRFPELLRPVTRRWMDSENIWLQRTAIICQRFYKKDTDADLLFGYILEVADSKEFFLQKGAGWALREYSKVAPEAVADFIEQHDLPALTSREGMKWIRRKH